MDLAFANVFTLRDLLDQAPPPGGEDSATSGCAGARGDDASAPPGPLGKELDKKSLKTSPRGKNAKNRGGGGANSMKHLRLDLLSAERILDEVEGELEALEGWVCEDELWAILERLREVIDKLSLSSAPGTEKASVETGA